MRCVLYLRVSTDAQAERDDTEEGFSLPAQREACMQYVLDQGWEVVDEYVDHDSASKNGGGDRPQFKAMMDRIFEQSDVDAVVVHKVDRFARDAAHHLAARSALRKKGVTLVSVTERLEESASGRLVEGIHALMAEYYSANLSAEVKKGMRKKVEFGGWAHRAPIGYMNKKEWIEGRRIAYVVPDPERAPLIKQAFELYATGNYTIEQVVIEMEARGLRNRGRKDYEPGKVTVNGMRWLLGNKFYMGTVWFQGAEHRGRHEPLIDPATFMTVQSILESRGHGADMRERVHQHHLKGLLTCGVCGRKLSLQRSKGKYLYFYCLGQKDRRRPTGCQEGYIAAEILEQEVEDLYSKIQLKSEWAERLHELIQEKIANRWARTADETEFQTKRLERLNVERRKLLNAYYAGAVDVKLLREEQDRISKDTAELEARLALIGASQNEEQEVYDLAIRLAADCAGAYRKGNVRIRRLFNEAVFDQVLVRDGHAADVSYREPFGLIFSASNPKKFEYGGMERETGFEPATSTLARSRSTK